MRSVRGSDEPVRPPDSVVEGDAQGKQITWKKHVEAFHHHHNESISTSASDSANSSPTTTVSTVDDSSATEMSPGSSPESPMAKPFPSSYLATKPRPSTSDNETTLQPFASSPESQRPTTPGRRPRNLKNLAVNTSGPFHMSRAASTTSLPMTASLRDTSDLDVTSRAFSKPPSPPKRRPTNLGLTILTPANSQALPQNIRVAVPPTPSLTRPNMLRHFQSSPSLPLHTSSRVFEATNSFINGQNGSSQQLSSASPITSDDSEPNFDIPLSKEEKPEAYPDGPICVYGPQLDLYLEPTAEQALGYDVIVNVASEVKNPFTSTKDDEPGPQLRLDGGGGIQYAPRRGKADTAKHTLQRDALSPVIESSPIIPQPTPLRSDFAPSKLAEVNQRESPEYIHIPWEHNTDIVPDTLQLVKTIDERITEGKRVLIHCQCGVSRSATLVVAYVIYKNPTMSVQEAYDAVKRKSKWIGPNMNLIMQLQEFRSALLRPMARYSLSRGLSPISPSLSASEWGLPGPHADDSDSKLTPKTAPLPAQDGVSTTLAATGPLTSIGPGPSSAPSGFAWPSHDENVPMAAEIESSKSQDAAYVDPSGHVIPVVKVIDEPQHGSAKITKTGKDRPHSLNLDNHTRHDSGRHLQPLVSPRSFEFAMAPLQPPEEVDSADTFGLMSPTASEVMHTPWDREALLGSLGMGPAVQHQHSPRGLSPPVEPVQQPQNTDSQNTLTIRPKLRPRLSTPSLQEQRQLSGMRSGMNSKGNETHKVQHAHTPSIEQALMSPRAFEFTQNPFALMAGEPNANTSVPEGVDPRSPAHKGVSPITRNIFDVL